MYFAIYFPIFRKIFYQYFIFAYCFLFLGKNIHNSYSFNILYILNISKDFWTYHCLALAYLRGYKDIFTYID